MPIFSAHTLVLAPLTVAARHRITHQSIIMRMNEKPPPSNPAKSAAPTPSPDEPASKPNGRPALGETIGKFARHANLAYQFIFSFAAPAIVGYIIDANYGTAPVGVLIGLLLGFSSSMWLAYREIQKQSK